MTQNAQHTREFAEFVCRCFLHVVMATRISRYEPARGRVIARKLKGRHLPRYARKQRTNLQSVRGRFYSMKAG